MEDVKTKQANYQPRQVRKLEKALEDEFDPERRVHGWARPGTKMDREDFIDLAKVSKSVPGKDPQQVRAMAVEGKNT